MMGAFQLPPEVHGSAAGVLVVTSVSIICGILLTWLVISHREQTSYVGFIAYPTLIASIASFIQQLHDYCTWQDLVVEQFQRNKENPGSPETILANGSFGLDLVLFYIQFCCYNIDAMFIFFWAFSLLQSVYGWYEKPRIGHILRVVNVCGKVISILVPIALVSLLQLPAVQRNFEAFLMMADVPLLINLIGGCLMIIAILIRYIHSRYKLRGSNAMYGSGSGGRNSFMSRLQKTQSLYDRWLVIRFTIAFVILGAFSVVTVFFQLSAKANVANAESLDAPDASAERARTVVFFFLPGVFPSIVAFIVFGTTAPFREHMYKTFVPARYQRQEQRQVESQETSANRWSESPPRSEGHKRSATLNSQKSIPKISTRVSGGGAPLHRIGSLGYPGKEADEDSDDSSAMFRMNGYYHGPNGHYHGPGGMV